VPERARGVVKRSALESPQRPFRAPFESPKRVWPSWAPERTHQNVSETPHPKAGLCIRLNAGRRRGESFPDKRRAFQRCSDCSCDALVVGAISALRGRP